MICRTSPRTWPSPASHRRPSEQASPPPPGSPPERCCPRLGRQQPLPSAPCRARHVLSWKGPRGRWGWGGGARSGAAARSSDPGQRRARRGRGQVNTRFVMEMGAQPRADDPRFGERRPPWRRRGEGRYWRSRGQGAVGAREEGPSRPLPRPRRSHATRPFSCKSAHAFATFRRPAPFTSHSAHPHRWRCHKCTAPQTTK